MKKLLASTLSLLMFVSPIGVMAQENEEVEDVVVEEEIIEEETATEEVVVEEETTDEIIEVEDDVEKVKTNAGSGYWRKQADGRWKFQYESGAYARNEFLIIGGYNYYFDANGYMKTGWLKYTYSDGSYAWLYYDGNGHEVSGWKQISGKWYYFDPMNDNFMAYSEWHMIEGKQYYFLSNGSMAVGVVSVNGTNTLFDEKGIKVTTTGWTKVNGYWYYTVSGKPSISVKKTIDGYTYYFDENGHMSIGWAKDLNNGQWYYYDEKGHEVSGWRQISGKWYYLDPDDDNAMAYDDVYKINGSYYVFQPNGAMANSGWVSLTDGVYKAWFYANSNGKLAIGWKQVDGQWYYLDPDNYGLMASDEWIYPVDKNGVENCFYMNPNGTMHTGWLKYTWSDGTYNWYYYQANGKEASGWLKIDGKWYYFIPDDNEMANNCTLTIDGVKYQFDAKGNYKKI